jgi:hypothetical protein
MSLNIALQLVEVAFPSLKQVIEFVSGTMDMMIEEKPNK